MTNSADKHRFPARVATMSAANMNVLIGRLHKYHNAPVSYAAMHHFITEMCTCVDISGTQWCIVGYLPNELRDL